MQKPHIICHMVTSIDGKVTGDFLYRSECRKATDLYYEINRALRCSGFICGRVTMEGSFTNGWYPDLTGYAPVSEFEDFLPDHLSGFYAVAFDSKGRLGWKNAFIDDEDPGYDRAQIVEVLTKQTDGRYLAYLQELGIPYLFAGDTEIDVPLALHKLRTLLGTEQLLLEGGSILNGAFHRTDLIDELSIVIAPMTAGKDDKPLFSDGSIADYSLRGIKDCGDSVVWMHYQRSGEEAQNRN